MKRKILPIMILVALVFLFSCGKKTSERTNNQNVDVDMVRTEAVATFASSLTRTMTAVPEASPTLTSLPTFTQPAVTLTETTPAPQNTCYDLIWIKDLTIPDGTQMKAGEVFTKTWLVQNNGGCAWAPGFIFGNVGGEPMRGAVMVIKEPIPVGLKYELSVELVVPSGVNGLIQSSWRMADANRNYFGDTLSVNIVVGAVETPAATVTP